jgi:putative transposase
VWDFSIILTLGGPEMKKKQHTDAQIIGVLKEYDAGARVEDLARRHGVSENTIYRWKSKFGGMEVSEAKRLLADAMLDNAALKEINAKKW